MQEEFLKQQPPWVLHPNQPYYSGVWRQGDGEFYLNTVWFEFWKKLNDTEKEKYLEVWQADPEWRQYLKEDFLSLGAKQI